MKRRLFISVALVSAALIANPAAARNYDCSKAGNATKAACKSGAPAAAPKPTATAKPAAPYKAAPRTTSVAAVSTPARAAPVARNYDCSKAGNANKAICRGGVANAAPAPRPAPAKRATPVAATRPATPAPRAAVPSSGNVVAWRTKTGKIVHYDCSKAGNATKQACRR